MKKIKAISSFLEPFTLIATVIGLGVTVATNNYKYLAIPSISSIPIVTLSRLKSRDNIRQLTESYKVKIDKLRLEANPNYQNEKIEKISHQLSKYQQQSRELQILLDSQAKDLEKQVSNYQNLYNLYYDTEQKIEEYQAKVSDLIQESLHYQQSYEYVDSQLNELQAELDTYKKPNLLEIKYDYELIFDRLGSRQVLIEALQNADQQLLLVCPWLTQSGINYEVERLLIELLENNVNVFIGWGHRGDLDSGLTFNESNLLNSQNAYDWKYKKLSRLKQLQSQYNNLKLVLLGTHEKYLVCDYKFAMIGSHNFLTSGDSSTEREIGIKINDFSIIKQLIQRFGHIDVNNFQEYDMPFPFDAESDYVLSEPFPLDQQIISVDDIPF